MGIVTRRPDNTVTSSPGNWTKTPGGSTVATILSDDSDLTFLSTTNRSSLPSSFAVFDIQDLTTSDIPDAAAIKTVTLRAKVLQVAPPGGGGSSFLSNIIRFTGEIVEEIFDEDDDGGLGDFLSRFFRHLFSFPCPTPPGGASPTWQTITIKAYPGSPSGKPWTRESVNAQVWRVGRSDLSAQLSKMSEFYIDVEFNYAPVLTIIGPNPTTVDGTTRPIITTTYTDIEGDPQAAIRFRIFTADQVAAPGFQLEDVPAVGTTPGISATPPFAHSPGVGDWIAGTSTQWLSTRDLPNGEYVVYAQAKQQWDGPELLSQWDAYTFTMDVDGPAKPVVTATPDYVNNWVQLDLIPSGPSPATETYNIYKSDNAGITWQLVWGGWQVVADTITGSAVLVDYLAPLNQSRWYKALSYRTLGTVKVASDESDIVTAVPLYHEFALKDPFAPSLNQPIGWMDDSPEETRAQGVHIPLVASGLKAYPIVVDGPLQGITGDSKLLFIDSDDAAWDKWKAIRAAGHTLLLQYPTGEQHWIRLKGEAKWSWRTDGNTGVDFRILEWGYIEVKPPLDPGAPASVQETG